MNIYRIRKDKYGNGRVTYSIEFRDSKQDYEHWQYIGMSNELSHAEKEVEISKKRDVVSSETVKVYR